MHGFWIYFQSALDSELLHLALAALGAVFCGIAAVVGLVIRLLVKRAITKWFERQDNLEKRITALESAPGFRAITDGRTEIVLGRGPTDGGLGNT